MDQDVSTVVVRIAPYSVVLKRNPPAEVIVSVYRDKYSASYAEADTELLYKDFVVCAGYAEALAYVLSMEVLSPKTRFRTDSKDERV